MSDPYIGQIEMFGFDYAPKSWAQCNGQSMSISQNQALFALLGTTYGGNGVTTFNLPDLRGRVPLGFNATYPIGQSAGEPSHTLSQSEIPSHPHFLNADATTTTGLVNTPASNVCLGRSTGKLLDNSPFQLNIYNSGNPSSVLAPATLGPGGGNAAHDNMMPYVVINFCICLYGIFPSRN